MDNFLALTLSGTTPRGDTAGRARVFAGAGWAMRCLEFTPDAPVDHALILSAGITRQ
ncbi:hypothetical protein KCP77_16125 [Salmonella enterica subsp. enterica]|nr:hypothetical protein KCP77_16125 [Salmonella enterica subsp. enterica]